MSENNAKTSLLSIIKSSPLVAGAAALGVVVVVIGAVAFANRGALNQTPNSSRVQNNSVQTSSTQSTDPSTPVEVSGRDIPGEIGSRSYRTYKYDYLGISFTYPADWSLKVEQEDKSTYFYVKCDQHLYDNFLRDRSLCQDGKIFPEVLTLQGSGSVSIRLEGFYADSNAVFPKDVGEGKTKIPVQMYEGSHTINLVEEQGSVSTSVPVLIKTGSRSAWKQYYLSAAAPSELKQTLIDVLSSFKTIN